MERELPVVAQLRDAFRYAIYQGGYAVGRIDPIPNLPLGGLGFTNGTNHFAVAPHGRGEEWMWGSLDADGTVGICEERIEAGELARRVRQYVNEQARAKVIFEQAFGQGEG